MANTKEQQLLQAIQSFDHEQAKQLCQQLLPKIDEIVENDNSTILHIAANYNNHEIIKYFLEQYQRQAQNEPDVYTQQRKKKWINKKDNEGFTCMHYSVFRGNSNLAFFLQEQGADIYIVNKQGLTVLHIAAQGDSPVLMYYFLNKGMKISAEDAKGSTALHWACYSGQENAAYALISWGAQLDKQDYTYGMTPLHLAVMSGNGRIVKKLLVKGCDRNIRNFNNRLPLEIAQQNQYKNITEMILDKRGIQEFLNVKTPYRKIGKYTFPFFFFIVLYLINYILNISFVLFRHFPKGGDLAFTYLVIGFIVAVLFVISSAKKPGYIDSEKDQNTFTMLKRNHPSKICFECMLVKPQRSRHCQICHRCISVYDHHCPWVANCIGAQNYCWFFLFIFSIYVFMVFTIVFEGINISQIDWSDHSALEIIRIICIFIGLLVSVFFLIPLSYLLYTQTVNCCTNKTTFERFGSQKTKTTSSVASKTTTYNSQTLKQNLLQNNTSILDSSGAGNRTFEKSRPLHAEIKASPCNNCYQMCYNNSKNIVYQVGTVS